MAPATTLTSRETPASRSLLRVQRRVFAIGFFTVTIHGVLGLIGVAHVLVGEGRHDDAVAMVFMSGVAAVLVYLGVRAILAKPFWSPGWIALALAPTAAAFVWVV